MLFGNNRLIFIILFQLTNFYSKKKKKNLKITDSVSFFRGIELKIELSESIFFNTHI